MASVNGWERGPAARIGFMAYELSDLHGEKTATLSKEIVQIDIADLGSNTTGRQYVDYIDGATDVITSGVVIVVRDNATNGIVGILMHDTEDGADGTVITQNPNIKVRLFASDTPAQGVPIYWDVTNRRATTTAGANIPIGFAHGAKETVGSAVLGGKPVDDYVAINLTNSINS